MVYLATHLFSATDYTTDMEPKDSYIWKICSYTKDWPMIEAPCFADKATISLLPLLHFSYYCSPVFVSLLDHHVAILFQTTSTLLDRGNLQKIYLPILIRKCGIKCQL